MPLTQVQPGMLGTPQPYNFKNRIINGAMVIDQRNAGASVTPVANQYTLDRWAGTLSQASKYSVQQNAGSVTPPVGFNNYLGVTSLSAYSVTSTDFFSQYQVIEGYNFADLGWGTANAKTITISFQVYSSLTGTFGGTLLNSAANRCYVFSYSIPVANTWTTISVTIAGDTTGTWLTTNGVGCYVVFSLGAGSSVSGAAGSWGSTLFRSATGAVSVVGTNGATFYITGVQFEVGVTATGFDYRPYGTELQLCQRYFYKISGSSAYVRIGAGPANATTSALIAVFMQTPMRAVPSSVTQTGALGLWSGASVFSVSATAIIPDSTSPYSAVVSATSTGLTSEKTYQLIGNNDSTASIALSAEL
jgi:hypothetical protein